MYGINVLLNIFVYKPILNLHFSYKIFYKYLFILEKYASSI